MSSDLNEKIYDMALISKVKKQTGPKKLKKILKTLRKYAEEDLKKSPELKVKILKEDKEEEKKPEFKIVAPVFGFKHYLEDLKKSNSIVNSNDDHEGEDTPSDVDCIGEPLQQKDSSDFSSEE